MNLEDMPEFDLLAKMSMVAHVANNGAGDTAARARGRLTEYAREWLRRETLNGPKAGQGI